MFSMSSGSMIKGTQMSTEHPSLNLSLNEQGSVELRVDSSRGLLASRPRLCLEQVEEE